MHILSAIPFIILTNLISFVSLFRCCDRNFLSSILRFQKNSNDVFHTINNYPYNEVICIRFTIKQTIYVTPYMLNMPYLDSVCCNVFLITISITIMFYAKEVVYFYFHSQYLTNKNSLLKFYNEKCNEQ